MCGKRGGKRLTNDVCKYSQHASTNEKGANKFTCMFRTVEMDQNVKRMLHHVSIVCNDSSDKSKHLCIEEQENNLHQSF